ncbi:hypothetical protein Cgig2_009909 [Carnegiea gigantea]|uniref:Uncharacterized protein n=1 Tax=Carnegiea gigantea TaxID=171969 RepID=A0A9Q1K4I3_9CARY|nr:hypothetical protein Cgig2_009909 [Carnegiea gigantea]
MQPTAEKATSEQFVDFPTTCRLHLLQFSTLRLSFYVTTPTPIPSPPSVLHLLCLRLKPPSPKTTGNHRPSYLLLLPENTSSRRSRLLPPTAEIAQAALTVTSLSPPPGGNRGGERDVTVRAAWAISAVGGRSLERRLEVFSGRRRRYEGRWFPVVLGEGGFRRRQRRCRTEGGLGMGVGVVT